MYLKKLAFLALPAIMIVSLLTPSCKKSNDINNNSTGLSATVGTKAFVAPSSLLHGVLFQGNSYFQLGGGVVSGSDSLGLALSFSYPVVLNHKVSSDSDTEAELIYLDKSGATLTSYFGGFGEGGHMTYTVTSIDSVNHKIGGSFDGVIYNASNPNDSLAVTSGAFNIAYTVTP